MPEKQQDFRGVSLKRDLVNEIEIFIKEYPEYKSIADFVHEAVRVRMTEIRKIQLPRLELELVNFDESGVKVLDRSLHKVVQVYFKPDGIKCEECETDSCKHIQFAILQSEVQKIISKKRKEGWKVPEL